MVCCDDYGLIFASSVVEAKNVFVLTTGKCFNYDHNFIEVLAKFCICYPRCSEVEKLQKKVLKFQKVLKQKQTR